MKKILFLFILVAFNLNIFGQISETPAIVGDQGVEDIYLAKDDGSGQAGDIAATFATTDIPIYCVVKLSSTDASVVKMNFIAVSVKGVKPESKVVSVSYKTVGGQNQVNFTGKPDKIWIAGNYRVDIFINDKPAGNRQFEIQKPAGETEKAKPPVVKKSAAKNRVGRRTARN